MTTTAALPRVLLVEDDPVSRAFLQAAISALPADVDSAGSLSEALALASQHRYDAWLIDANLPDGTGSELLERLRANGADAIALAHTATDDREVRAALIEAGFREVLVKPLPPAAVQRALREALDEARHSPHTATPAAPVWDDGAAARALSGNLEHVAALRRLFIAELPGVRQRVADAVHEGDVKRLHGELHRLRASCGFVGAARLGRAAQALHAQPQMASSLREFERAAEATLVATRDELAPA